MLNAIDSFSNIPQLTLLKGGLLDQVDQGSSTKSGTTQTASAISSAAASKTVSIDQVFAFVIDLVTQLTQTFATILTKLATTIGKLENSNTKSATGAKSTPVQVDAANTTENSGTVSGTTISEKATGSKAKTKASDSKSDKTALESWFSSLEDFLGQISGLTKSLPSSLKKVSNSFKDIFSGLGKLLPSSLNPLNIFKKIKSAESIVKNFFKF